MQKLKTWEQITYEFKIDKNSYFNSKPLEKETYRKYNKQPKSTLFEPSSYKKQSNTFF